MMLSMSCLKIEDNFTITITEGEGEGEGEGDLWSGEKKGKSMKGIEEHNGSRAVR